jgi:hypothetical protein
MTTISSRPMVVARQVRVGISWLGRPLSGWWCALGWMAATAVFVGMVRLVGGISEGDAAQSAYSTWAIAHGHFACAFPPATTYRFPSIARPVTFVAPLWPILSGGLTALAQIGHTVPFPSQTALGPHCSTALVAMYQWSIKSGAVTPTVRLGYVSWLALMAGVVALLRATGRGRCGWEPLTLVLLAFVPTVPQPLVQYFHPQDLVAMGLALGGLACVRRGHWAWAGLLLGLAVTSQQFALLVAAPLVMVVPRDRRMRFVGTAIGASALVILPMLVITSGRALRAVLLGSGNTASLGGTVLRETHISGGLLVVCSRILPIIVAMALARWAGRRLGSSVLEPIPLLSLIGTSLSLRLVFEQNIFGYYFMALAVALVLGDVVGGRIRGQLVAWLVMLPLAFSPVPWGFYSNSVSWGLQERELLPFICMGVVLLLLISDMIRGRIRWYLAAWFGVAAIAFARLPWSSPAFRQPMPVWFWQVVLVGSGVALAFGPLLAHVRNHCVPPCHTVDSPSPTGWSGREHEAPVLAHTGIVG